MARSMMVMAPEPKDFAVTLEQFRMAITDWPPHAEPSGPLSAAPSRRAHQGHPPR